MRTERPQEQLENGQRSSLRTQLISSREVQSSLESWLTLLLADFVADWTPSAPSQSPPIIEATWQQECYGAYCKNGSGASAILTAPLGTQLKYAAKLVFQGCTNNVTEYEGLLLSLRIKSDSELITNHIGKTYRALKPELEKYLVVVRSMEKYFLGFSVRSFPRL